MISKRSIVVFGATGQQGGAVVSALQPDKWHIRAAVRDPATPAARALSARGIETITANFADPASLARAMSQAHGVFSVQPSSGQGDAYGVSDADEVRYGQSVIDIAATCGVRHLVYSSVNGIGPEPTGIGHFDSKARVEAHLRASSVPFSVIRPSAFMEILLTPGLGLSEGRPTFFMRPEQGMQFIAQRDIGNIVARIFDEPARFVGRTIEIAGDTVTGAALAEKFSQAAGRAMAYRRFPDEVLAGSPLLAALARLVDDGRLTGRADIEALNREFPRLLRLDEWLSGAGRAAFQHALGVSSDTLALR
jgi:uncharacterized protein YbjT (DUF2867 family)